MTGELPSVASTMLLAFRAENVRSFRDQLEFSLEATPMAGEGIPRTIPWREGGRRPVRVLPTAGVFGANASGKTNLLRIMDDMRRVVLTSFRSGDRSSVMPRRPFRLDPECEKAPSRFEIDLILSGIRHEYGFQFDDTHVINEWAYRYPHGKAALVFRRDEEGVHLGESSRIKGRAVAEILRPNALFLSAASAASHPGLQPLYEWFESNLLLCEASSRESRWAYTTQMMAQADKRGQIIDLLNAADLGITDARPEKPDPEVVERFHRIIKVVQEMEGVPDSLEIETVPFLSILLSHRGSRGSVDFDSSEESLGTLVWLGLAGPVVDALASGAVLLVDELESSLHPTLVAQLVRIFQNARSNPNGAQLIFNSHEAGLLGNSVEERILGRDQVWFTEKLNDGSTHLYSLTDLNPRKAEAIARRYLAGRYGATPIVSSAEFSALAAQIASGASK